METNKDYLARLLPLLKKPIPHQWRVQSFSKNKPIATVMAYIDARDAQEVLDTYCEYGWHRKHQMLSDRLYCSVGIEMPNGTIMWREDCGTESNEDKEKGQASDALKRACVNWGVGRFLYDLPIQYVDADGIKSTEDKVVGEGQEKKVYKKFPNAIDKQGKKIWEMTKHVNSLNPNAPKAPSKEVAPPQPELSAELTEIGTKVGGIKTLIALEAYWNDDLTAEQKENAIVKNLFGKRKLQLKAT